MYSSTAPDAIRLADEFWLAVHDGGLGHRSTLSTVTRSLGLTGALVVELVDAGAVQVGTGPPGSGHQASSADGDTTLLPTMPSSDRIKDPALKQVYEIIVRNSDTPPDAGSPHQDHRAGYLGDPGWDGAAGRSSAWHQDDGSNWRAEPSRNPMDQFGYQPNPPQWALPGGPAQAMPGAGIPVRTILEYLAIENRAEQLVINRLLTTGLVRYETRRRLFGADTKVIVPVSSVISGRALARIVSGLQPAQPYLRDPGADPNAPRGLNQFEKRMAALFAATGVFDVDQTGLSGNEMKVLRGQLQTGIPAPITAVLRQVNLTIKSLALNR